jgi:hypothetical protein
MIDLGEGLQETLGLYPQMGMDQYLLIHINTIFRGMSIHLPAILM